MLIKTVSSGDLKPLDAEEIAKTRLESVCRLLGSSDDEKDSKIASKLNELVYSMKIQYDQQCLRLLLDYRSRAM